MKIRIVYEAEVTAEGTEDPKVLGAIAERMAAKIDVGNGGDDTLFGKCTLEVTSGPKTIQVRGPKTPPPAKKPAAKKAG